MKKLSVVFLGPPGVGKGTQSKRVSEHFSIPHISTGDILRAERKAGSPLGKQVQDILDRGELVPDDLVVEIVKKRLGEKDCATGFILDGFPRTVVQADALDEIESIAVAYNFTAEPQALVERISKRRGCPSCGAIGTADDEKNCGKCGDVMVQREDDREETVRYRLRVYQEQTAPLIDYYKEKGVLCSVDGMRDMDVITRELITDMERVSER